MGGELGTGAELTYSFVNGGPFYFDSTYYDDVEEIAPGIADAFEATANSDPSLEMVEFSAEQQDFITQTLQEFANISGLTLTEVTDDTDLYGDMRFVLQDFDAWVNTNYQTDFGGSYNSGASLTLHGPSVREVSPGLWLGMYFLTQNMSLTTVILRQQLHMRLVMPSVCRILLRGMASLVTRTIALTTFTLS